MRAADVPRTFCADRCAAWCQHNKRCNATVMLRSLRIERGARGQEEARRDCLKLAHYACLLAGKLVAQAGGRGKEETR